MRPALAAAGAARAARRRAGVAQFDPAYEAKQLLQDQRARGDPLHAGVPGAARAGQHRQHRRGGADPGRRPRAAFVGETLCWSYGEGCAGDVRLYDWVPRATARSSPSCSPRATARRCPAVSGATRAGPAKRPGVVIINGSVQASETLYWFAAQTLAKAGYVVLTFDPQNQGRSDPRGEAPTRTRASPPRATAARSSTARRTRSTSSSPRRPALTCRGRAATPARRTAPSRRAAWRPASTPPSTRCGELIDPARIGIAGHSYGAAGVSYVGQRDPRVKAVVAWDALRGRAPTASRSAAAPTPPSARRRRSPSRR